MFYHGAFSGTATLTESTPRLLLSFEQVMTGENVLCTSPTAPYDPLSGEGPVTCSMSFRLEYPMITPGGAWGGGYWARFFTETSPGARGPIGTPVNQEGEPRLLGLAVYDPDTEWAQPRATCGAGFYGSWTELSVGDCVRPQSVVPEPSTVILLATGLFGVGLVAWRRKDED